MDSSVVIFEGEVKGEATHIKDPKVTLAYGAQVFPALVKKLSSGNTEMKLNALKVTLELFKTNAKVAEAMSFSMLEALVSLIKDTDEKIRLGAVQAIQQASQHASGRSAILAKGERILKKWIEVLDESAVSIRRFAFNTLLSVAQANPGKEMLVSLDYVELMIAKSKEDADLEVQAIALNTLGLLIQLPGGLAQSTALRGGATSTSLELLASPSAHVRTAACRIVELLTFTPTGRAIAIKDRAIPTLLGLASDTSVEVRCRSLGAMMLILIDVDAKIEVFNAGGGALFIKALSDKDAGVNLNAVKCISNLAAYPTARLSLREGGALKALHAVEEKGEAIGHKLLHSSATSCVKIVEWNP